MAVVDPSTPNHMELKACQWEQLEVGNLLYNIMQTSVFFIFFLLMLYLCKSLGSPFGSIWLKTYQLLVFKNK